MLVAGAAAKKLGFFAWIAAFVHVDFTSGHICDLGVIAQGIRRVDEVVAIGTAL